MPADRQRDLIFDAIVSATQAVPELEGGRIAKAKSAILACCQRDGIPIEDVPKEIELRAQHYRTMWPHLTLTPTALATHWYRVLPKPQEENVIEKWRDRFHEEHDGT